jgi:phage shock protein E
MFNWFNKTASPGAAADAGPAPADLTLVIDVRTQGEFAGGHVQGSVNLPLDRLANDITRLVPDRATPVLLCCRSGARSGMACQMMQQLGYTQVRNGGAVGTLALQLQRPIERG